MAWRGPGQDNKEPAPRTAGRFYGFRLNRRAHDVPLDARHPTAYQRNYEWVIEGGITTCSDGIDHTALVDRVCGRVETGTPHGAILSPLLANIALSILDDNSVSQWNSWNQWD